MTNGYPRPCLKNEGVSSVRVSGCCLIGGFDTRQYVMTHYDTCSPLMSRIYQTGIHIHMFFNVESF